MTAKILTENGQVFQTSTYRMLTPDELSDKDRSDAQNQFMPRVHERLWSWVLPRELENVGLENNPQYDLYEDETQNKHTFLQLAKELEPMPKVGDHYVAAAILLPRGDEMARDHAVACSHDSSGNVMGRANTYPIIMN